MERELTAIVMGTGVLLSFGFARLGWIQVDLWRRRHELIGVTAEVLAVRTDAHGFGAELRVRYPLEGTSLPSGWRRRRPVMSRLKQPEEEGGFVETTVSSILLGDWGADQVDLLVHPEQPLRVTGRPGVSLIVGIGAIVLAAFLALGGWGFYSGWLG